MDYNQVVEWQEGIPDESGWYLVAYNCIDGKRAVEWAFFNGEAVCPWWVSYRGKIKLFTAEVTHWMEPPLPPS